MRRHHLIHLLFAVMLNSPLSAAPLFPDVPDGHWAGDAVAGLAAQGLLEGYPDGTFKGDRAATRWEAAIIVARLMAKMEAGQATFATSQDLQTLRKLTFLLRDELDALGVRVDNLEANTKLLDARVIELERITFYGTLDARYVGQTFSNQGAPDNDSGRNGGGLPGGLPYANYNQAVGTTTGGLFRPQINGVLPVVDYVRGRDLSNGTGFTARALLGVNLNIDHDLKAGLELVGYSSQGDLYVDGYWGLNAPYTAHPGTANNGGGPAQPLNHQPYTRMVLDQFWLRHESSGTQLVLGRIDRLQMDPLVYSGQANTSIDGPRRLNFGFALTQDWDIGPGQALKWELFRSSLGSRNIFRDTNYDHQVFGGDLRYTFHEEAGAVQLNFARYIDESIAGAPLVTGLLTSNNVAYGASAGWSPFQWVNPPGHFTGQTSAYEQARTGGSTIGLNTVDTRPIPGWNSTVDNAIGLPSGGGNYGAQSQDGYGISGQYRWTLGEKDSVGVKADFAQSVYRPNRNSSFESVGQAWFLRLDGALFDDTLGWKAEYLSVDPNYGPTRFRNGLIGNRIPSEFLVAGGFHAHDFITYPHNREGFRADLNWKFDQKRGKVWLKGEWLEQRRTSLYDVRVTPDALGLGVPNFPVIGFAPGYVDYYFAGFAHPNIYGLDSANSFTSDLQPLENPRGSANRYDVGVRYQWDDPGLRLEASYRRMDFERSSRLDPGLGGSQNYVDIATDYVHLGAGWAINAKHEVGVGVDWSRVRGHHDPAGLYNAYAQRIGSIRFDNIDDTQTVPFVSYDYQPSETVAWNVTARRYDTVDHLGSDVMAGRAFDTVGSSVHPFSWSGWQFTTTVSTKF